MEVRRFEDLEAFEARAEPHLAEREAESNLELGILDGVRSGGFGGEPPLLATVEDGGGVLGVVLRTPPFGLLLSSALPREGSVAVAEWLLGSDDPAAAIPGVQGEQAVAAAFVEAWEAGGGPRMAVHRDERIYRLTEVRTPDPGPAGAIRPAREEERGRLVGWFDAFAEDVDDPPPRDPEGAFERFVPGRRGAVGLYVWEVDGEPRSMAGHSGPTPHGMRVGPVYTPPAERRRGYAGALVAALSQRLLDEGREFCFLFTDLANPTSNHVYQEIGYEPVCEVTQWRVVEESSAAPRHSPD
jgi:hypothetical protein